MRYLFLLTFQFFCVFLYSQDTIKRICGTSEYMADMFKKCPDYKLSYERLSEIINSRLKSSASSEFTGLINIPVVVHVVYKLFRLRILELECPRK